MSRASEQKLSRLHDKLADAMDQALEPIPVYGDPEDTERVTATIPANNPALFTAVAKFLKDNEITATPEADNKLGQLRDKMDQQRQRRKLPAPDPADAQFGTTPRLQ